MIGNIVTTRKFNIGLALQLPLKKVPKSSKNFKCFLYLCGILSKQLNEYEKNCFFISVPVWTVKYWSLPKTRKDLFSI